MDKLKVAIEKGMVFKEKFEYISITVLSIKIWTYLISTHTPIAMHDFMLLEMNTTALTVPLTKIF